MMEIGSCASQVVGADLEAKMAALHALGFDFIEPAWRGDDLPRLGTPFGEELRARGERTGCPVRSAILGAFSDVGARLREPESRAVERDVLTRACDTLAAAGGDVLLLPNWAAENAPDYDDLYAGFLREAADHAGERGVRLAIEHIPASKYRNTAAMVFELAEMVDRPNVGVYYDIVNGLYIGDDPLETARLVAPRVIQYHVKDYRPGNRTLESLPLREVKAVFEAAGFRGRVATEIDPIEESGSEQTNSHLAAALGVLRQHGF
jgi:4-hydroxyphenylpyruvate dioxygenase